MASAPSASKARAIAARLRPIASARGKQQRVLQLTTLAFFLSFVVWFNFAPFSVAIGKDLHLTPAQLGVIGLCNLALTIPARVFAPTSRLTTGTIRRRSASSPARNT